MAAINTDERDIKVSLTDEGFETPGELKEDHMAATEINLWRDVTPTFAGAKDLAVEPTPEEKSECANKVRIACTDCGEESEYREDAAFLRDIVARRGFNTELVELYRCRACGKLMRVSRPLAGVVDGKVVE